jgi:hypothetical protein
MDPVPGAFQNLRNVCICSTGRIMVSASRLCVD